MNGIAPVDCSRPRAMGLAMTQHPEDHRLAGRQRLRMASWGVLGRLLDEPRLRVAVASGTSAGAMIATMFVQGHTAGGEAG